MAEDELFCERPAKMADFRLAFDTRAKKLSMGRQVDGPGFGASNILRLDFCAALRYYVANAREMVTSGAWRGNIWGVAWI
jgi:hypothetical protein